MEVAYDATGLATAMAGGDLICVYSIVPEYEKTVTLRGNIANPGRFAWHEGMRLSELIPDKDSLLTRNYWWQRAQMGLPAPEFEPAAGLGNQRQPTENQPVSVTFPTPQDMNAQDQSGLGQSSSVNAQQQAGSAPLAAAQTQLPSQPPSPGQRTQVRLPAPEIDWDYAVIERLNRETLKTELIPFDLGKLVLQHDASQDLELQPNDVVSIFSEADIRVPVAEQTKLVRLEGEFVHAGVYSVQPGETLRHLIERAGGLRPMPTSTLRSSRANRRAPCSRPASTNTCKPCLWRSNAAPCRWLRRRRLRRPGRRSTRAEQRAEPSGKPAANSRYRPRSCWRFSPTAAALDSIPDIALEDGDRFRCPARSVPPSMWWARSTIRIPFFMQSSHGRAGICGLREARTGMPTAGTNSSSAPTEKW